MIKLILYSGAVLAMFTAACGRPPKQAMQVPAGLREAIEKNVLAHGYAIYATGRPGKIDDLRNTTLLACGCDDSLIDVTVADAFFQTLQQQIFRSSQTMTIADNMSCPGAEACMTSQSNVSMGGGQLARTGGIYGNATSQSALLHKCLESARAAGNSVIVVPRKISMPASDGVVELKFE